MISRLVAIRPAPIAATPESNRNVFRYAHCTERRENAHSRKLVNGVSVCQLTRKITADTNSPLRRAAVRVASMKSMFWTGDISDFAGLRLHQVCAMGAILA